MLRRASDRLRPGATRAPLRRRSRAGLLLLLAAVLLLAVAAGCYNKTTGRTEVGGKINFKLPAFPETGSNAIQIYTEMHYQPSYRAQEGPRILPPPDSVPVTGRELRYTTIEQYRALEIPDAPASSYDQGEAQRIFDINCQVCHGQSLTGDGPILGFWPKDEQGKFKGATPADLTDDPTRTALDGELFGFISRGGRQGLSLWLAGRESTSAMPEFALLLSEDERWALVQYLRSRIGR